MKLTRLFVAFLALALVCTMTACGGSGDTQETTGTTDPLLQGPGATETTSDNVDNTEATVEATDPGGDEFPEEEIPDSTGDHRVEEDQDTMQEELLEEEELPVEDGDGDTSGGGGSTTTTDEPTTDDSGDETGTSTTTVSAKPLSWDNLKAFPTKSSSMSVAQMRDLCVSFFRYAKTATWTPSVSINYIRNAKGANDSMKAGTTYGGLPYIGLGSGTVYRLLDYLNPSTGVVDMNDALDVNGTISVAGMKYFGNQCANGAHSGWGRVINSVKGTATATMTKANGYIPVGPYTYSQSKWSSSAQTKAVCQANGQQVMFQSYAKLQPADGLVYYTTAGHVIMCSSAPVVSYNADGTINGNSSYLYIIDQAQSWEPYGGQCQIKNSVDAKKTFSQLFASNYVPFTFGEFLGTDPVEGTSCNFSFEDSSISTGELFGSEVSANYSISDVYVIVTDNSGSEVYRHAVRGGSANTRALSISRTGAHVDSWGTYPASGSYNVEILVQLYTGERRTVYSGTLKV